MAARDESAALGESRYLQLTSVRGVGRRFCIRDQREEWRYHLVPEDREPHYHVGSGDGLRGVRWYRRRSDASSFAGNGRTPVVAQSRSCAKAQFGADRFL